MNYGKFSLIKEIRTFVKPKRNGPKWALLEGEA